MEENDVFTPLTTWENISLLLLVLCLTFALATLLLSDYVDSHELGFISILVASNFTTALQTRHKQIWKGRWTGMRVEPDLAVFLVRIAFNCFPPLRAGYRRGMFYWFLLLNLAYWFEWHTGVCGWVVDIFAGLGLVDGSKVLVLNSERDVLYGLDEMLWAMLWRGFNL